MNTTWRTELPQWLLLASMFLLATVTWPWAPDHIPLHWSFQGEVDGYGGRFEGLLAIPLLALGIYVLMLVLPRFDPGHANYRQFATPYTTLRLGILTVLWVLYGVVHLWIRGYEVNVANIVPIVVGVFFVVMGGLLGKIRPNWFVGIRTPWTLSSKLAWTRTHRLAGWLFLLMGVTFILAGLLPSPWTAGAAFAVAVGRVVWMVAYSYLVWRTDPDKTPPAGTLPA